MNLEFLSPMRDMRNQYPFRGDEELDLNEAMELMDRMQSMDDLERQLERTQYGGDIDDIDEEKLRELLGDEAAETLDQLKQFLEILEEQGYIQRKGNSWELTPRGTRKIGQKALGEIYSQLKQDSFGKHALRDNGRGGERADDTKKYEFGDPFHLALDKTIMNSLQREGATVPVKLSKDDFEVYRSENLTQTATVMMVDLSWSMALRGSFQAAKKVALALNNLIRSQFTRDSLYIIGFSAYARELKAEQLPYVRWDESVLGTNMHHALMLAQNLLSKHKAGTRQIIMISDGEPTAHLKRPLRLRLPTQPHHDPRDAQGSETLHAEGHRHQHLHAGSQLLPQGVRQPGGEDQQGPRLLHHTGQARAVHPRRLRPEQAQERQRPVRRQSSDLLAILLPP